MLKKLVEDLRGYRREVICAETGISFATLSQIMSGANTNPTIKTFEKLQKFVEGNQENEQTS